MEIAFPTRRGGGAGEWVVEPIKATAISMQCSMKVSSKQVASWYLHSLDCGHNENEPSPLGCRGLKSI